MSTSNLGEVIPRDQAGELAWMIEVDLHGVDRVTTYAQLQRAVSYTHLTLPTKA